jgi:hypothetical protein
MAIGLGLALTLPLLLWPHGAVAGLGWLASALFRD